MKASRKARFGTLLALLIIPLGLFVTILLVKNGSVFNIGATPSQDPQDLRITNISDSSFTLTYTTSASVLGTINFSSSSVTLDSVVLDDRDQLSQTINKYSAHTITVRQLQPETTYFFQINSGNNKYINGDSPYSVKTGKAISSDPSDQSPITGKVLQENGSAPREAIVYVKINGAQDLSALTKSDGSYTIPLNSLRTQDLDDYYVIPPDSILSIEAVTNNSSSKASTNLNGINSVPPLTLSNNYDFSSTQVSATVKNPSETTFPEVGKKAPASPTSQPSTVPTQLPQAEIISLTPTLSPTPIPDDSVIAQNASPQPSEDPQPTIVATGDASVIMIPILGSVLVALSVLLFVTTGKKLPL